MLLAQDVPANLRIQVLGPAPSTTQEIELEISRLWEREALRRGNALFNGQVLSAVRFDSSEVVAQIVEYRWLIAQRLRPELFTSLGVRPLAVSGLLHCRDGVVFGLRARHVTEAPGTWELVPSGGMDARAATPDIRAQIHAELREEMGLDSCRLATTTPFCSVEDTESHVIDIGVKLEAPELSTDEVRTLHRARGTPEYDILRIVSPDGLAAAVQAFGDQLLPVSRILLERAGLTEQSVQLS